MTSRQTSLQLNPSANPAIYRPQYRPKAPTDGEYVLQTALRPLPQAPPSLLNTIQALQQRVGDPLENGAHHATRWHPTQAAMLRVYWDVAATVPAMNADLFKQTMLAAMQEWQSVGQGLIGLSPTVRPQDADITIELSPTPIAGRPYELGHTDRQLKGHWIHRVTMTLVSQPAIDTQLQPRQIQQRVYSTLLHELGHALGLEHSQNRKDVMHHQGWQNIRFTPHDIQQLHTLYQHQDAAVVALM